jgi:hypothetical protein
VVRTFAATRRSDHCVQCTVMQIKKSLRWLEDGTYSNGKVHSIYTEISGGQKTFQVLVTYASYNNYATHTL